MGAMDDFARRLKAWDKFLNETVPERLDSFSGSNNDKATELEFDTIVIGFGAAGAACALDAADAGFKVLLVDRFDGGGSTVSVR